MEKPLLTLKPSIINALLPTFLRNLTYSFIVILISFGILTLLEVTNIIDNIVNKEIWLLILLVIFSIVPLLMKIIALSNTTYYFFKTHLSREFEFIIIKKHSVPYHQIVNIKMNISIWDRLCKAGDIILHTAEDKNPDLILHFIREPEKIEKQIYGMLHIAKKKN